MAKSAKDELIARIEADIARLQGMREYVLTNAVPDAVPVEKKTRKKRTPRGLPAEQGTL